jgi:hypothetical protein
MGDVERSGPVNSPVHVGRIRRLIGSALIGTAVVLSVLLLGVMALGSLSGGVRTIADGDWVPGVLLLVFGIGAGGGALIVLTSAWSRWRLTQTGTTTVGTVVEATKVQSGEGPFWAIEYTYSVNDQALSGSATRGTGPPSGGRWEAGQHVVVVYHRKRPSRSVLL